MPSLSDTVNADAAHANGKAIIEKRVLMTANRGLSHRDFDSALSEINEMLDQLEGASQ